MRYRPYQFLVSFLLLCLFLLSSCSPPPTSTQTFSISGIILTEKDFIQNKMFFLDTAYLSFYLHRRPSVPDVNLSRLQVWLSNDRIRAEALSFGSTNGNFYRFFGPPHLPFKLLKMGRDYALDSWGVIRFDSITIDISDYIGIHFETEDSTTIPSKGVYVDTLDTSKVISDTLWTFKSPDYDSTCPVFPLMWRNVYSLPSNLDIVGFKLRVVLSWDTTNERAPNGRLFTEVLGLCDNLGRPLASNSNIFDVDHHLLIIPPFDSSSNGNEPFSNPALGLNNTNTRIYKMTGADFDNVVPKFMIFYIQRVQN